LQSAPSVLTELFLQLCSLGEFPVTALKTSGAEARARMGGTASKFRPTPARGSRRADTPFNAYTSGARRNSSGYVVTPQDSGGTCASLFRSKTSVARPEDAAPPRRPTRKPSDPNDAVFSPSHAHPMVANLISELAQSGILAELDSTAREVAAGRVSPFDDGDRPDGPDPSAPVKIRARSILRRNSSITATDPNAPAAPEAPLAPGAPRVGTAARKLTWSSFERVQVYDVDDKSRQCSFVHPGLPRRKSTGSSTIVSRSTTHSHSASFFRDLSAYAASLSSDAQLCDAHGGGGGFAMDRESHAAAARIAQQLTRHEIHAGGTASLDPVARCGKMLRRKVTPRVAAMVEDAAFRAKLASQSSAAVDAGYYGTHSPGDLPRDADGEIIDLDPASFGADRIERPKAVATAGDALLAWISAECETRAREREETTASVESMDGDVVRLLARVDAMCDAVPSRRLARALRDLHRARLRLVDARAKARVLDSTRDYLRGIVLDARDVGEEASARASGGRVDLGRAGERAGETMAGEFFYCLALGGMLR